MLQRDRSSLRSHQGVHSMVVLLVLILITLLSSTCLVAHAQTAPPSPPRIGAISSGVYRNMFLEAGYSQTDIDARLLDIYTQLLAGDPSTEAIVFPALNTSFDASYVEDINNQDVRTEGMSYGLMWTVQLDIPLVFDRIFNWYKRYMQHPAGTPMAGYASWHCTTAGVPLSQGPAPDGETWVITALLFAARRWGDAGAINYTAEAEFVLTALLDKENSPCGPGGCDGVQNMFGGAVPDDKDPPMVRFSPGVTDPSYQLPSFYEQWAISSVVGTRADYWRNAANVSRSFFHNTVNAKTGLAPYLANFDGSPNAGGNTFEFDSWRVARNIATDLAWYAADYDWQVDYCNRLLTFFRNQPSWPHYGSLYDLDGTVLSQSYDPGLAGMNAVCALASNQTVAWDFVHALWNQTTPTGGGRYYSGSLYLEAWLHLSGNFRADWSNAKGQPHQQEELFLKPHTPHQLHKLHKLHKPLVVHV